METSPAEMPAADALFGRVVLAFEGLGPIVSIVPGSLHALHLTLARGLDPERRGTCSR